MNSLLEKQCDQLEQELDRKDLPVLQTRTLGLKPRKIKNQIDRGLEPKRSRSRRRVVAVRQREKEKEATMQPRKEGMKSRDEKRWNTTSIGAGSGD